MVEFAMAGMTGQLGGPLQLRRSEMLMSGDPRQPVIFPSPLAEMMAGR